MARLFQGKLRRLGNSIAVIIPNEIINEVGVREGDTVKLSMPIPETKRKQALRRYAGSHMEAESFMREKRDRF